MLLRLMASLPAAHLLPGCREQAPDKTAEPVAHLGGRPGSERLSYLGRHPM